jgi:mannose-6-phosphate isomerase-like protein (cupin superfamily)
MRAHRTVASILMIVAALVSVATLSQNRRLLVLQEAPLDQVVAIPREKLNELFRNADRDNISTTRMLEGGEFNVNIRHVENVSPDNYRTLVHPDTIDVWVVQEGSGVLVTGGVVDGDKHSGGDERLIGVGDLIYIPAGIPHGMKETVGITWLNIRFPEHRN